MDIVFEILSRLTNQKNGVVTDSMTDRGISYKLNYGVALHTIRRIALEYAPDHQLAQQLYERDEREAKLAAIYVEDPTSVTAEQVERWAEDFTNAELAEVICTQLLYKTPHALPYSYGWCQSYHTHLQKAGWTLVARIAQLSETTNQQLIPYLKLVEYADLSSTAVRQAVTAALVKFGIKNEQLQSEVTLLTNQLKTQSSDKQIVASEVLAFLQT